MSGNHEINTQAHEAFVKSVEAATMVAEGRLDEARALMAAAAALDLAYAIRAEFIGHSDSRKVAVSKTIRQRLVPFLQEVGFAVRGGGSWSEGNFLERSRADGTADSVLIGRDKFGHQLGVMAARRRDAGVEYFDWRTIGIHSRALAYVTQRELEAVCDRWRQLITVHVFPWWDEV